MRNPLQELRQVTVYNSSTGTHFLILLCLLLPHTHTQPHSLSIPESLSFQLTVSGVGVVAARGVFSPLLLALHLSGGWQGGREEDKSGREGGGQEKERKMTSEKMFTMKTQVLMK